MIEVRVRVDDEADRLARNRLLGRRHHRHAARVALAALDDEDVIAHVDGERRVVAADLEGAVAELLDGRRCLLPAACAAPRSAGRRRAGRAAAPPGAGAACRSATGTAATAAGAAEA